MMMLFNFLILIANFLVTLCVAFLVVIIYSITHSLRENFQTEQQQKNESDREAKLEELFGDPPVGLP